MLVQFLFVIFLAPVVSFYKYGHETLGSILLNNVQRNHFELFTKLNKKLSDSGVDIKEASSWADKIKREPKYCRMATVHYSNLDTCNTTENEIKDYCETQDGYCLYNGLKEFSNPKNNDEFKFFIHFSQDIFQPLHSYGKFRGGNEKKVTVYDKFKNGRDRIRKMSLHALWDDYLFKLQMKNTKPEQYIENHRHYYHHKDFNIEKQLVMITNRMLSLSCNVVYNFSQDNVVVISDYYNDEYNVLINDYLTFVKSIIGTWN